MHAWTVEVQLVSASDRSGYQPLQKPSTSPASVSGSSSTATNTTSLYGSLLDGECTGIQQNSLDNKRVGLYRLRGKLGVGAFSKVKFGVHLLTNEHVAVKVIDKTCLNESTRHVLSQEISCMAKLNHPNLIRLFEVIDIFSTLYLVMECAGQGTLQARIATEGPFGEEQARCAFAQLSLALNHMHKLDIVHRDIKADNILLTERFLKLADFGFSTHSSTSNPLSSSCGSTPYAAPEIFTEDSYLGRPADIWAMGVTLYFMLSGRMPFVGDTLAQIRTSVVKGEFPHPKSTTSGCEDLLRGLLCVSVSDRLTMESIFSNSWVQSSSEPGLSSSTGDPLVHILDEKNSLQDTSLRMNHEILQNLKSMGLPLMTEGVDFSDEPRNPTMGTYRILLHRKHMEELQMRRGDCSIDFASPRITRRGEKRARGKFARRNQSKIQKNSVFCTLL